jgi:hypothetical protein
LVLFIAFDARGQNGPVALASSLDLDIAAGFQRFAVCILELRRGVRDDLRRANRERQVVSGAGTSQAAGIDLSFELRRILLPVV